MLRPRLPAPAHRSLDHHRGHLPDHPHPGRGRRTRPLLAVVHTYIYGAAGDRLLATDPQASTVYLEHTEVRRDAATGQTTATRYYGDAVRTTTDGLAWITTDHHGTGQLAINSATLATTRRRTTPFGEQRGTPPATWPDRKGFVGGTTDPTGLTHLGAREYDPTIGRFISPDPLVNPGEPQTLHAYAYANNSPITYTDPDGLAPCGVCGGGGGGGAVRVPPARAGGGAKANRPNRSATAGRGYRGPNPRIEAQQMRLQKQQAQQRQAQARARSQAKRTSGTRGKPTGASKRGGGSKQKTCRCAKTKRSASTKHKASGKKAKRHNNVTRARGKTRTPTPSKNVVYRNLTPRENPSEGLTAENPNANYHPAGHVTNGSKPTWKSQFISTTRSREVAEKWSTGRTVEIDLNKFSGKVIDLTTPELRAAAGVTGHTANRLANASQEVLLVGYVPPGAIRWVVGGP